MFIKMEAYQKVVIVYILAINCIAYIIMCFDKYLSKNKGQRISENTLFFLAFIFGAIGIYFGMKAPFYHKAAKEKFKVGIPILIILNGICVYFIYRYL